MSTQNCLGPNGQVAAAIAQLSLETAKTWRAHFGYECTTELHWFTLNFVIRRGLTRSVCFHDLHKAMFARFGLSRTRFASHLGHCVTLGYLRPVAKRSGRPRHRLYYVATARLKAVAERYLTEAARNLVSTYNALNPWSPIDQPKVLPPATPEIVFAFWDGYAENWHAMVHSVLRGCGHPIEDQDHHADRLFKASYWYIIMYIWLHTYQMKQQATEEPLIREQLRHYLFRDLQMTHRTADERLQVLVKLFMIRSVEMSVPLRGRVARKPAYCLELETWNAVGSALLANKRTLDDTVRRLATSPLSDPPAPDPKIIDLHWYRSTRRPEPPEPGPVTSRLGPWSPCPSGT